MVYDVWSEGYLCTGQIGCATLHGRSEGSSFKEACMNLAKIDAEFARYFNPDMMTYWGCGLYDNEYDAKDFERENIDGKIFPM